MRCKTADIRLEDACEQQNDPFKVPVSVHNKILPHELFTQAWRFPPPMHS